MFKAGDVIRYYYLWHEQSQKGEYSGRKPRPACVVVKTETHFFLFPITSQKPYDLQFSLKIPEIECKRTKLKKDSWLRVDEFNVVPCGDFFDFEHMKPQGCFSIAFMRKIALKIKEAKAMKPLKKVSRH
ncbi:Uncharacterised protein [Candidatus Bartonella washoeensis]|uniref:PemK-like protein n=1 Tax=Candidatus Bartonella washoeensis Sb944nv TaxID=1094563 RepID=J0YSI6_9HYPH|nr:hypothetical protein [Bartonella washoeensis]EJF77793.1 hypothetical protein MCQ_01483 [Bartonella washoeensis Sb944nv]SPU26447.1 Uncharacterised protein [Bartonella washoeensis]